MPSCRDAPAFEKAVGAVVRVVGESGEAIMSERFPDRCGYDYLAAAWDRAAILRREWPEHVIVIAAVFD